MEQRLGQLGLRSAAIYAFFLIPTLVLFMHAGFSDVKLSQLIQGTWQAKFWELPLLSKTVTRIIFDVLTLGAIFGLGWQFWQGFKLLRNGEVTDAREAHRLWQTVMLWTALAAALLVPVVPFHSSDIYGYINRGFQQSVFGTNPYLITVGGIPGWKASHLFHEHWIHNPCPYGFFFAGLTWWLTATTGASFTVAFMLFKVLNFFFLLASTDLVYRIAVQMKHQRPWLTAYLFGANPLVLLQVMGNGHNDILMVCLMLGALWCLSERRWVWACLPLLTLSVLTKYTSLLVMPFVMLYMLRNRQFQPLAVGTVISLGILVLLGMAYVDPSQGWPWTAMLDNAGKPQHSIIALMGRVIYYVADIFSGSGKEIMDINVRIFKMVAWAAFAVFCIWQVVRFLIKKGEFKDMLYASGMVVTVMVAFISAKFHAWYVVMFLPLVLLLPEKSKLRRFGILFSLFQLGAFSLIQNVHILGVLLLTIVPTWLAWSGVALPGFPIPAWARRWVRESRSPEPSLPEST